MNLINVNTETRTVEAVVSANVSLSKDDAIFLFHALKAARRISKKMAALVRAVETSDSVDEMNRLEIVIKRIYDTTMPTVEAIVVPMVNDDMIYGYGSNGTPKEQEIEPLRAENYAYPTQKRPKL